MDQPPRYSPDRAERLRAVLDDCVRRRGSGEVLPDQAVLTAHPDLLPELAEQLRALALVEGALGRVADDPALTISSPSDLNGSRTADAAALPADSFAGYQILREIHRGGQGVVYQALQKSTKRKVAIKVMREGPFAGPADRARFEREVQILGQLQHPNIVAVHDSGTAAGIFYFVMDYISGQPLDVYMASGKRSIEETLRLFAKICNAVNAAHLRGVIHRDLKPGNIRVDPSGEPHILDFGLAKVSALAPLAENGSPVMTVTGQFVGSLPWASPEQAEGVPSKIDVRTDVYSLGVILYQMLTGKFPYEVVGAMRDVLDRILTAEPARPSTIRKQINDEVETMVLKCLSKERERRYQTAGELARDIARYLAGEPIEAKRDSALYVLRKQLRRYRLPAFIAAAFVLLLTGGMVVSFALWQKADSESGRARAAEKASLDQLHEATAAREAEEKARHTAERTAYSANLLAAQLGIQAYEFSEARQRLAACPPELRGWEWSWLTLHCETSLAWLADSASCIGLAYTRAGTQIYGLTPSGELRQWDAATFAPLDTGTRPAAALAGRGAFVGVDGSRLVTADRRTNGPAGSSAGVRLVATDSGQTIAVFDANALNLEYGAFSADGYRVVLAWRERISVYDARSGAKLDEFPREPGWSRGPLAFSADGTRVAEFVRDAETICVFHVGTADVYAIKTSARSPQSMAFDAANTRLALAEDDGSVTVYDTVDRDIPTFGAAQVRTPWPLYGLDVRPTVARLEATTRRALSSVAFSPDGTRLAAGSVHGSVYVWEIGTGQLLCTHTGHDGAVRQVAYSPDGLRIVSAARDGIRVWPSERAVQPSRVLDTERRSPLCSLSFSADGARLVMGDQKQFAIWDGATGSLIHRSAALPGRAAEGQGALARLRDRSVWSSLLRGRSQQSRLLAIRPDGTQLVISDRQTDIAALKAGRLVGSETISLTDSLSGEPIIVLAESELYGGPAAYSADGKRLALRAIVAPEGGAAPLWSRLCVHDAGSGRFVRAFDIALQESVARGIALNSNGTLIAVSPGPVNGNASGSDGELLFTVLDVESGATVCCAKERGARGCRSLAFASDSGRIVSISGYNALCVWDASNGQLLGTVRGHDGRVNAAVFSPDGARIVSAGEDGTLRVWDSASFELLLTIRQHTTPIHGIAYSPDGMRIVSAGDDGVRLFDARPRKQILAGLDTPPYGENAR